MGGQAPASTAGVARVTWRTLTSVFARLRPGGQPPWLRDRYLEVGFVTDKGHGRRRRLWAVGPDLGDQLRCEFGLQVAEPPSNIRMRTRRDPTQGN